MGVVVYAEDLSGRKDDGHYTKPDIASALDLFFDPDRPDSFLDSDAENPLTRAEAEMMFHRDREITFYNEAGEKVVISRDWDK